MRNRNENLHRSRGHAALEAALLMPWIAFLFVGAFDVGCWGYGLIATQNAARVAALYTSQNPSTAADSIDACIYALDALRDLPNVATSVITCGVSPVTVTAAAVTGTDGAKATQVTVSYTSATLIPIPGLLPSQYTFTRSVQMRLISQS
jgi:Flp pilus assembly protein TadG